MKRAFELDFEKLYLMAEKKHQVDFLEHNILTAYLLYRGNFDFRKLLLSQRLTVEEKVNLLVTLPCFKESSLFFELIGMLLEKEKATKLFYVQEGFSKKVSEKINRIMVQVFTAVPLKDDMRNEIASKLELSLKKKVLIKSSVDPSLLGGIVIKLPNGKIYNFSFKNALSDLKCSITEKD